ncbi:MAG: hypothetical protein IAF02_19950 [Anaerolineae bacterium]|nr:hypothetical protein [Anaerolineae bacterium]
MPVTTQLSELSCPAEGGEAKPLPVNPVKFSETGRGVFARKDGVEPKRIIAANIANQLNQDERFEYIM